MCSGSLTTRNSVCASGLHFAGVYLTEAREFNRYSSYMPVLADTVPRCYNRQLLEQDSAVCDSKCLHGDQTWVDV